MTTPTTAGDTAGDAPTSTRTRLAAAAAKRATKTRRTTTRKSPAVSRNATAAKRGKYAARISSGIKTGAKLLGAARPVHAAIIAAQADEFADALDEVAAEDARVAALLDRVSGAFGKGGAWGKLGGVVVSTGGALMLASGTVPAGPAGIVLAFLAGEIVQAAAMDAAADIVRREAAAAGIDPDPARVPLIAAALLAPKAPPADELGDELGDEERGYGLGYDSPAAGVPTVDEREHRPAWAA